MFILNLLPVILLETMPIWILFIILIEKPKKQISSNLESVNQETTQKSSLISHIYIKNRWVWLKTVIIAIIFIPIYFSVTKNTSGMGMAALALPLVLAPFIITGALVLIVVVLKFIFSILEYYFPNQKKFHIPKKIIFIIIIVLIILNFAEPFVNKYFRHSNQINQNSQINSQVNNEALSVFVKATFRIKDTNETFTYIENYIPNIPDSYDYDQNAVSNCISWDLQGNFLCKKVYFIENGSDKKRLAIYNEKSDAVIGKIDSTLLFSEGKFVTQLPNPHKIGDTISYIIDYKFNGQNYRIQSPENLCKNDKGEVTCHDPSFKINDKVITFHTTGLLTKSLYGVYRADKVIEADLVSYQEYKYGEVSPVINVN